MGKKIWFLFLSFSVLSIASNSQAEENCSTLMLTRCDTCHYLTRACYALGKKSKWGWRQTIRAMVGRGAKLTDEEQKILVECLGEPTEEAKTTCRQYYGP